MRRRTRFVRFGCASLALLVVLGLLLVDRIPAGSLTRTRLEVLRRRLLLHAREHGRVPERLDELSVPRGIDASLRDGWGRAIGYEVRGDEIVLTSLGRDGLPGGVAEDRDRIGVFAWRSPDGGAPDERAGWVVDPAGPRPSDR